jgi:hypothetical protein
MARLPDLGSEAVSETGPDALSSRQIPGTNGLSGQTRRLHDGR